MQRRNHLRTFVLRGIGLIALAVATSVVASAQSPIPPTARQAAQLPQFATRLAHAAATQPPVLPAGPRKPQSILYENGPFNGTADAWTINYGYVVANSFQIPSSQYIGNFEFYVWVFPGDKPQTVDWFISSAPFGGTTYGHGTSTLVDSYISTNEYGYEVHRETGDAYGTFLDSSTKWLNLGNAVVNTGNPVYWDENSGVGCQSQGCPSLAESSAIGTIPSESFIIFDVGGGCSFHSPLPSEPPVERARVIVAPRLPGASFQVIHNFSGEADDGRAAAGPMIDWANNVYGPAGAIYKLSLRGSDWIYTPIYRFAGGSDGANPNTRLLSDPYGRLFGTTTSGGGNGCYNGYGCGTVYELRPPTHAAANVLGGWEDKVLYSFSGASNGFGPMPGALIFDPAGNLYGATSDGGLASAGSIYELTPIANGWQYKLLYSFSGGADGAEPISNLMLDEAGNLFGAAYSGGGFGCGTIFELTPSASGWTQKTLYTFRGGDDSGNPLTLVRDQDGTLFGATIGAGCADGNCPMGAGPGGVFMLSRSGNDWQYSRVYDYQGYLNDTSLTMDSSGDMYGTLARGGSPCYCGEVFKLSHEGGWTFTVLHDFNVDDGWWPFSNLAIDSNGNIYGVTQGGGANNAGVVYQITP